MLMLEWLTVQCLSLKRDQLNECNWTIEINDQITKEDITFRIFTHSFNDLIFIALQYEREVLTYFSF